MTKMQCSQRIVDGMNAARPDNPTALEPVDVIGALNADMQADGVDVPTETECDQLISANPPTEVANKYPATLEMIRNN